MPQAVQPDVLGHGEATQARRVRAAEIAVDVVQGQPCIGQGAQRDLGVQLGGRHAFGATQRVFVDAGDAGLAVNAHDAPVPPHSLGARLR